MASFEISGSLISKKAKVGGQGNKGPWEKQEFLIETLDKDYPKKIAFTAWNDTIKKLSSFKQHEVIKVSFSAETRVVNDKWFTELRAYKIESGETMTPKSPTPRQSAPPQEKHVYQESYDDDDSSHPF